MVTKNKLIFDILNIARGGQQSDDEPFSEEQVSFWIDNTRNLLIRRDLEKSRTINPDLVQTICAEVIEVDGSECGCVIADCTIFRIKDRLPTTVELYTKNLILRVGPVIVGSTPFSIISYNQAPFAGNNKWTKKITKTFLHNGYIYLIVNNINQSLLTHITIDAIFEYPEEASKYSDCNDEPCYTNDSRYPISGWMIEPLKDMIMKNDLKIGLAAPSDKSNNADHDVQQNIPS
jgi:hypothetical protein